MMWPIWPSIPPAPAPAPPPPPPMASGASPSKSNDDVRDFVSPQLVKPVPLSIALCVRDYGISRIGKVLSTRDGRSIAEMEAVKKVRRIASFTLLYTSFLFGFQAFVQ